MQYGKQLSRRMPLSLFVLSFLIAHGCTSPKQVVISDQETPSNLPSTAPADGGMFDRPVSRLDVEFNVQRFSSPRGVFTGKESTIWRIVNRSLPNAAHALTLGDNGFRAAIGHESDRTPLTQTLDALRNATDIRSKGDRVLPDAAKPIEIELGNFDENMQLFYFNRLGRLAGKTFAKPKALLLLSFEIRPDSLRQIDIKITPAIEEPPGPLGWIINPNGFAQQVPQQRRMLFNDLAIEVSVPEGGFLLLGPTKIVYDRPYLARPFFLENTAGPGGKPGWRESIYVISPIIRREVVPMPGASTGDR